MRHLSRSKKTYPRLQNLPHTAPHLASTKRRTVSRPFKDWGRAAGRTFAAQGGNGPRPERSEPPGDQCVRGTNRRRTKAPPMPDRSTRTPATERAKALFLSSERTAPGAGALRTPILIAGAPHAASKASAWRPIVRPRATFSPREKEVEFCPVDSRHHEPQLCVLFRDLPRL